MKDKRFFNRVLFVIALFLCFFKTQVFAYEALQNQIVDEKKVWRVNFNKPLNVSIDLQPYFKVIDSKGNVVKGLNIELDSSRKTVFLSLPNWQRYSKGEVYRLYISKEIQSQENKKLLKDINMNFSIVVKEAVDPKVNSTYYVAANLNKNGIGSIEDPFSSIESATSKMKPGDTLLIRGGLYSGRVDINDKRGTQEKRYTIKPYPGEKVLFEGGERSTSCFVFTNSSYWNIEGINITKYFDAGIYITSKCSNITMNKLRIWDLDNPTDMPSGVEGIMGEGETSYCIVSNCEIFNVGLKLNRQKDHGVYIGYGADHWTFENNDIHNNSGAAIQLYGEPNGGSYCTIKNNKMYNNNYCGLRIANNATGNVVTGNTFYGNKDSDFYINGNSTANLINGNVFGSLEAVYNVAVEDTSYSSNSFDCNIYKNYKGNCIYTPGKSIDFKDWQKTGMETHGSYYNK